VRPSAQGLSQRGESKLCSHESTRVEKALWGTGEKYLNLLLAQEPQGLKKWYWILCQIRKMTAYKNGTRPRSSKSNWLDKGVCDPHLGTLSFYGSNDFIRVVTVKLGSKLLIFRAF